MKRKSLFQGNYEGIMFEIFNAIQSELKFNYTLVKSEDEAYGKLNQSKQWTGQIGLVQRGEIDFSIMDITMLLERSQVQTVFFIMLPLDVWDISVVKQPFLERVAYCYSI
jgi:hypothetical protein